MIFRSMKKVLLQLLFFFIFAITISYAEIIKEVKFVKSAIFVTSDKCYESNNSTVGFKESNKLGEVVVGIVKRIEFGNLIIDLGKSEAIIKREELIPRETFKNGDRVRAYIYDVKEDAKGYQVFLSRTHP